LTSIRLISDFSLFGLRRQVWREGLADALPLLFNIIQGL